MTDDNDTAPCNDTTNESYKAMDVVYVREGDGLMYKAIIRRALYGPKFQRTQALLAMGETYDDDEDDDDEPAISMWHYFVHFPGWKVTHDRWASASDVFVADAATTSYAETLTKEHRTLHKHMSSKLKGRRQKVNGVKFLAEWSKRMNQITAELPDGSLKEALKRWQMARQGSSNTQQQDTDEDKKKQDDPKAEIPSDQTQIVRRRRNNRSLLPLPPDVVQTELKLRKDGLTSKRRSKVSIPLPFGLKKILVEQWELICQCDMLPILPAPITIRQALDAYVASKGEQDTVAANKTSPKTDLPSCETPADPVEAQSSTNEEWQVMADGIAKLFNESLPVRLLYEKELSHSIPDASNQQPYTDIYGCEHLLRLFVKLPDILSDNLTVPQCRPIVAKVNDLIRFLHKNHSIFFRQHNHTTRVVDGASPAKKPKLNDAVSTAAIL